jgi:hypothetical protein
LRRHMGAIHARGNRGGLHQGWNPASEYKGEKGENGPDTAYHQ